MLKKRTLSLSVFVLLVSLMPLAVGATTYYVDPDNGDDGASGESVDAAWASLSRASLVPYEAGDQILLRSGARFRGKLVLQDIAGSEVDPIVVGRYGTGALPVIDSGGYFAAVHLIDVAHVIVRDLEITANGGATIDNQPNNRRHGVLGESTGNSPIRDVLVENLVIYDIFPEVASDHEGANPTTFVGNGVTFLGTDNTNSGNIVVRNCQIERTGFKAIELKWVSFVELLDNSMKHIGGPALQMSRCSDIVVRGNMVDGSGSYVDSRMHGRGSGIWPWSSDRVLIEKNTFMGARGRGDSCGMHIDYNCQDVIVQYNLSIDNAGGFIEILGNNFNCTYRYNISINDGQRKGGVIEQGSIRNNHGGYILWISGYRSGNFSGPTNSYLYNNTFYVGPGKAANFNVHETADGLLVANNLFYIEGSGVDKTPGARDDYIQSLVDRVDWRNNLYLKPENIPTFYRNASSNPSFTDTAPVLGDPVFANAGGLNAVDYIPQARAVVEDLGIIVQPLEGDLIGIKGGLAVDEDILGNKVVGLPDFGAIEVGGTPEPLPPASITGIEELSTGVRITANEGPYNTEYYFTETSGNYGGTDSGWISVPYYDPGNLMPNTVYAYTVKLRDSLDQEGSSSEAVSLRTPKSEAVVERILIDENFATNPNPANAAPPTPSHIWYVAGENEAAENSVSSDSEELRLGWGYDSVAVFNYTDSNWRFDHTYLLQGQWKVETPLDRHDGFRAGIGAFDPATGQMVVRIKELATGVRIEPEAGQTGTFYLYATPEDFTDLILYASDKMGIFFERTGNGTPDRNDVYHLDNIRFISSGTGVDTDKDGIPDAVESSLGLNPGLKSDGLADRDGDGQSNAFEFVAGTNPDDSRDALRAPLALNGDALILRLNGTNILGSRYYILEQSTDLKSWHATDAFTVEAPPTKQTYSLKDMADQEFVRLRIEWK